MTNQLNQEAFDKWVKANYPEYPPPLSKVWQAATQASESEINSLKQRVEELQADNLRLREASQALVDRWHTTKWKDAEHTATFIHALEKALSLNKEGNNE